MRSGTRSVTPTRQAEQPDSTVKHVTIYTDGSCLGNPGPGGYGAVLLYGSYRRELSGGFRWTTNNRMELMAVIAALEALKESCQVTLVSDSEYVVKAMGNGWASRWKSSGWKRGRNEKVMNPDLWARLLEICQEHQVEFRWVRGHDGDLENERCDALANDAATRQNLPVDSGYVAASPSQSRAAST